MTECVILYRVNGGRVQIVYDDDGHYRVEVFANRDVAIEYCDNNNLFASATDDYQIVELDEL